MYAILRPYYVPLLVTLSLLSATSRFAFAQAGVDSSQAIESRPNFIFIITDDQRWDILGCVQEEQGDKALFPWFKTPNMDRIAEEGARFRNAFVVHSLCSPSRAAFLTGQQSHEHGVRHNWQPLPLDVPTWASGLQTAGYATGYFGKWHMGQQAERPGFSTIFSYVGQGVYNNCVFLKNGEEVKTEGWVDDVTTDHAVEFIKSNHDKPFGMVIGYKSPHEPRKPPARTAQDYKDVKLTKPATYMCIPPFRPEGFKPLDWGNHIYDRKNYFRCVSAVDDCVGRVLDALDQAGLSENTMVVFVGDNGYYLGEHASHDKRTAYEESLRIPLLVRYPKMIKPGTLIDDIALNIDLAPTILELAGAKPAPKMHGQSWVPMLQSPGTHNGRKSFLYENYKDPEFPDVTFDIYAWRTQTQKLVTYPGHPEWSEAFDLTADPLEMNNVIDNPAFSQNRKTLVKQLEDKLNQANIPPVLTSE